MKLLESLLGNEGRAGGEEEGDGLCGGGGMQRVARDEGEEHRGVLGVGPVALQMRPQHLQQLLHGLLLQLLLERGAFQQSLEKGEKRIRKTEFSLTLFFIKPKG